MSTRDVKPPPATPLSSFLSLFLALPFLLFDRAAGFPSPRPQDAAAGARRVCQGWSLFSGHRQAQAFTRPSTTADLMGRGRLHSCLLFFCLECQRALFR